MNDTHFKMLLHKIDIVTIVFLIFFGISFLGSSDKEKRIEKRIEKIEETLQVVQ